MSENEWCPKMQVLLYMFLLSDVCVISDVSVIGY